MQLKHTPSVDAATTFEDSLHFDVFLMYFWRLSFISQSIHLNRFFQCDY